jgi:hypothetical protein
MLEPSSTIGLNIRMADNSKGKYKSVDARMFKDSSLMGTFSLPPYFVI